MKNKCLYRALDLVLSVLGIILLMPLLLIVTIICLFDTGSPFFIQKRVGRGKKPFSLVKFRTMKVGTASVATHLASSSAVTKVGSILRHVKLDELPQLINVLKGDMSLVGPRPCLFNQVELIEQRDERGVFDSRPGITGLAQVKGIDMSTPTLLAETDEKMIHSMSLSKYCYYISRTAFGSGRGDAMDSASDRMQ